MVENFQEELAPVQLGDKWGFINHRGKVVIPFQFDKAGSFQEGFARVKLNGKWGVIKKP